MVRIFALQAKEVGSIPTVCTFVFFKIDYNPLAVYYLYYKWTGESVADVVSINHIVNSVKNNAEHNKTCRECIKEKYVSNVMEVIYVIIS